MFVYKCRYLPASVVLPRARCLEYVITFHAASEVSVLAASKYWIDRHRPWCLSRACNTDFISWFNWNTKIIISVDVQRTFSLTLCTVWMAASHMRIWKLSPRLTPRCLFKKLQGYLLCSKSYHVELLPIILYNLFVASWGESLTGRAFHEQFTKRRVSIEYCSISRILNAWKIRFGKPNS